MITRSRVALVNNTTPLLKSLTEALMHEGLSVLSYKTGTAALKDPRLPTCGLMVSDWTNPPLGGLGLWHELQKRPTPPRVVFLSPWADEIAELLADRNPHPLDYIPLPSPTSFIVKRIALCLKLATEVI